MLHNKSQVVWPFVLVFALVLTACGNSVELPTPPKQLPTSEPTKSLEANSAPSTPGLDGTEWVLVSFDGHSLVEGTNITLNFADGTADGFAGCNAYGGPYTTTNGGGLSISEMAITAQACLEPEGVMEQETSYVETLWTAATYRIVDDGLEILNDAAEPVLAFVRKQEFVMNPADLVGTQWSLISMNGKIPIEGSTVTIAFDDEARASGHAGCRDYEAAYEAQGDDMLFTFLSMHGDDVCLAQEALALQEGEYTTMLEWVRTYRLGENRLELLTARGEILTFEPLPKDVKIDQPELSCDEYLDLWVSLDEAEEQAVVSSYQCQNLYVDSTGMNSAMTPSLIVPTGSPLNFRLGAETLPESIEIRIYPEPGLAASFLRWPEELPIETSPVAQSHIKPSSSFQILPEAPSGEYSLVIRATWESAEVFYAVSFMLK